MLVQRINWLFPGHEAGAEFYLKMLDKYPKSYDEIWLTTISGFPPLEKHKECAEWFSDFAEELKRRGIKVSLQLANSIGHGDMIGDEYDCTGLTENPRVRPLVGEGGEQAKYCFCWNNRAFRDYSKRELALYAEIVKPHKFWIDDDLRPNNHLPVINGCFCPDCIEKFNSLYGTDFNRERLVEKILDSGLSYRERWVKFIRDGLGSYVRELCEAVQEVSPETEFGFQNCDNGSYSGYGYDFIFDQMRAVNGKAPHYRAGGGFYYDHNPDGLLEKGLKIAYQHSFLPYFGTLSPEIECLPNTAFGKSVAGILLETAHYLALGAHDMTYNVMDDFHDPFWWHEEKFREIEKMRPYFERLGEVSKITKADGLRYFVSEKAYNKPLKKGATISEINREYHISAYPLVRDGIPIVYDEDEGSVFLLYPDVASIITRDEAEKLKKRRVITCGESVAILNERGFDLGFSATPVEQRYKSALTEMYEPHPLNGSVSDRFVENYYTKGRFEPHILSSLPEGAEILGKYKHNVRESEPINGEISTAIIPLKDGGEWCVFGYSLWKTVKTIAERDRILNVYDRLANTAGARLLSPVQAAVNIRKDSEGKIRAISLTNCTVGKEKGVRIFLKKPFGSKAVFQGQYAQAREIQMQQENSGFVLELPTIEPWSVATVFFE